MNFGLSSPNAQHNANRTDRHKPPSVQEWQALFLPASASVNSLFEVIILSLLNRVKRCFDSFACKITAFANSVFYSFLCLPAKNKSFGIKKIIIFDNFRMFFLQMIA